MLKKDFWYDLPKELIAQEPADPRDSARLMVLSQKDDSIQHKIFHDLPEFLEPGDLLVVNNSKVLPARIVGVKQPTGAVCELTKRPSPVLTAYCKISAAFGIRLPLLRLLSARQQQLFYSRAARGAFNR